MSGGGFAFARSREIRPRFCSEFGFQSYPSVETVLTFLKPDQIDPKDPDFAYHQKCRGGHRTILRAMAKYFSPPKDTKSMIYLSQVQQAVAIKMGVEHFRSIRPRCMGAIYWQLCDNWPVASWSSIEYGGKWKHLQYHARRFYAPCVLTVKPAYKDNSTLEFWAMNDKDEPLRGEAKLECWTLDGTVEKTLAYALDVPARSARKLASLPVASFGDRARCRRIFLALSGTECPDNEYVFASFRVTSFAEAKTDFRAEEKDGQWRVTLSTDKPAFFVWVDAPGVKGVFSDDSFTLLPGRPKTMHAVYLMLEYAAPVEVTRYEWYVGNDTEKYPLRNPRSWRLQGSADGTTWTDLDTVTDVWPLAKNGVCGYAWQKGVSRQIVRAYSLLTRDGCRLVACRVGDATWRDPPTCRGRDAARSPRRLGALRRQHHRGLRFRADVPFGLYAQAT